MTSAHTARPVLAVTLGDVAGIGPEIVAKTLLQHRDLREKCVPVVVGDADAMRAGALRAGLDPDTVRVITDPRGATNDPGTIELVQTGPSLADVPVGELSAAAGDGAYRFVVEACRLARDGYVDAIVTAPLNKAAMHAGGHKWPGHTELLAHEFGRAQLQPGALGGRPVLLPPHRARVPEASRRGLHPGRGPTTCSTSPTRSSARSAGRTRPSGSPGSTPTPGRTDSSVTRTPTCSSRRSPGPGSAASTRTARSRPTR